MVVILVGGRQKLFVEFLWFVVGDFELLWNFSG